MVFSGIALMVNLVKKGSYPIKLRSESILFILQLEQDIPFQKPFLKTLTLEKTIVEISCLTF